MTALIYRNALGLLGDLTYQYNAAGNRISMGGNFARTLLPDPITSATYDAANRQLTFGDKTVTFDASGNLISISDSTGTTTFTWDSKNQLVALSNPDVTAAFVYDPLGRRVAKQINGQLNQYLYDGIEITQELRGGIPVNYLRGLTIDEPWVRNGGEFYLIDALSSVLGLTDSSGTLITNYVYELFGQTLVTGTPSNNPFQYTSRENDGTGLYYYRSRYYSPALRRFHSEDLLNFVFAKLTNPFVSIVPQLTKGGPFFAVQVLDNQAGVGIISTLAFANAFSYANNAPTRFVDPIGLWYVDFNVSAGFPIFPGVGIGLTGGIMIGPSGIHPYLGPGLLIGPSPVSGSITFSPDNISQGWNCGIQGSIQGGLTGQIGASYGRKDPPGGSPYVEVGGGGPPGATASCFYAW